jgi:hypothetical protein
MALNPFKVAGPLTDNDAAPYIERRADLDAIQHLRAMNYLLLIEPRQQGKTSLINRLRSRPELNGYLFAYVYFSTPDRTSEARWYRTVGQRLLRQLPPWPNRKDILLPENSFDWRDFLSALADRACQDEQRIVISLDEIDVVPLDWSEGFFSVLRDIYNSRTAESEFEHITFLLAGTYNPRDLIRDDRISPFNIAHRVHLSDFTLQEVSELVKKSSWSQKQVEILAQRIYYWTDGQPYLTQLLCSYLKPDATNVDVDTGVERLRQQDMTHVARLLERINSDRRLHEYLKRILSGYRIKFFPGENPRHLQLELIGVIKADDEGYCRVRNRIYGHALPSLYSESLYDDPRRDEPSKVEATKPIRKRSHTGNQFHIHVNHVDGLVVGPDVQVEQTFRSGVSGMQESESGSVAIQNEIKTGFDEIAQMLDAIHGLLEEVQTSESNTGKEMDRVIAKLRSAVHSDLSLRDKIEFSLPIIPMFLEYKLELGADHTAVLNALMNRLKSRWEALVSKFQL